jgi:hypothetical protein
MSSLRKKTSFKGSQSPALPPSDYMPRHPLYAFKSEPVTAADNHLDNYVETRPFEKSEGMMTMLKLANLENTEIFYDPTEEHCFYVLIQELKYDDNRYVQFFLNGKEKWVYNIVEMAKNNMHRKNFEKIMLKNIKNKDLYDEIEKYLKEN